MDDDEDEADWQISMEEQFRFQPESIEEGPEGDEELLHDIEAEQSGKKDDESRKERRPKWTLEPSSHGPQEEGRSVRKRILKDRKRVVSEHGANEMRGSAQRNGNYM